MHTSHLVNARRKTDGRRDVEECEGNGGIARKRFSSESLRPFSFRRVTSFSPGQSCSPFGKFADRIPGSG